MKRYFVYILRCADDTLYTGWTTDVAARVETHNKGKGAKYTGKRSRLPVVLVYQEECPEKIVALQRECAIKLMKRKAKLALIEKGSYTGPK